MPWFWLWLLGLLNSLCLVLATWRTVVLRQRIDNAQATLTNLVIGHYAHTHDGDMHHACCGCIGEA